MMGYMFSFDALLGFLVSLVIIYTLLIVILVPYGYYHEFEQAYIVARDTGLMMYYAEWNTSDNTTYTKELVGHIISPGIGLSDNFCYYDANSIRNIIPPQYAFTVEYYNSTTNEWIEICDPALTHSLYNPDITCENFRKFKVYAPILIADYTNENYNPGDMYYCYISCKGYDGDGSYVPTDECIYTPCLPTTDLATRPLVYTGVVRIGVCI